MKKIHVKFTFYSQIETFTEQFSQYFHLIVLNII